MDLFDQHRRNLIGKNAPLADRMRPTSLDEFFGQEHIIGPGRLLRRAIQVDQLSSLIFYGPPGTGKTTLARIIAHTTKAQFISINAVLAGVKDIREAIEAARETLGLHAKRTILFIDEVHRFNKAQQDALLPHVENGTLILIGATTENPYFEVNKALVSRSRLFQLKTLGEADLEKVARYTLQDTKKGYGNRHIRMDDDAMLHLVRVANGDARGVLNALELAVETTLPDPNGAIHITRSVIEDSIQQRAVLYDKDGDAHYDTISAFIKSLRGSDPDAALYWMAKMLYAGEEPRFIFRRMIIFAGEDIGLADPHAIRVVMANAQAFEYVGLPEGRFHLALACLYCATAPKSNSTMAFFDALKTVGEEKTGDVPNHLKDASRDSKGLGHGDGYMYPHAFRDHWVAQQYLPSLLQGKVFYTPSEQGHEKTIRQEVTRRREVMVEAMADADDNAAFGIMSGGRGNDRGWAQRTSGNNGPLLAQVRDRILALAALQRDSLVLDAYARTGLLTFEAQRNAPEGGIWALTYDKKSFETLSMMAQRVSSLERPQILCSTLQTFDDDLRREAGGRVAFDAIIGRNLLNKTNDKMALMERFASFLAVDGRMILAETVHSASQKLSAFLRFDSADDKDLFLSAEHAVFSHADNPMVNWNAASLLKEMDACKTVQGTLSEAVFESSRRIMSTDIEYWLRETSEGELPSLGDHIRTAVSPEGFERIRKMLHGQLDGKEVSWQSVVAFVTVRNNGRRP